MRICKIRFKNLNSLVGEWEINLEDEAYKNGIFAISGPTGAGKTTILDAISLALYGKTPRLNNVVKSENEIMSRTTGECFAEVIFKTPKGLFRAHWSQQRARKKTNGDLQEPKHELADANSNRVLESKKRGVTTKVAEITGMDFDQFTRTIMLAQGSFATFLKANADDRSAILEKITGKDIYSEISRKVQSTYASKKNEVSASEAALKGIVLLSEEEVKVKTIEFNTAKADSQRFQQLLDQIHKCIDWLQKIEELQARQAFLIQEQKQLEQKENEFKEDALRLVRAKKTREIAPFEERYNAIYKAQQQSIKDKRDVESIIPSLQANSRINKAKLDEAEKQLHYNEELKKKREPVCNEVIDLDTKISNQQVKVNEKNGNLDQLNRDIERNEQDILQEKNRIEQAIKDSQNAKIYLELHPEDECLGEKRSGIEQVCRQIRQGKIRLQEIEKNIKKLNKEIESINLEKQEIEEKLKKRQEKYQANAYEIDQAKDTLTLLTQENSKKGLLELKESINQQQLLEAKIVSLEKERQNLRPGSPCPCCGSLQHPYRLGKPIVSTDLEKRIADVNKQIKAIENQENLINEFQEKRAEYQKKLDKAKDAQVSSEHMLSEKNAQFEAEMSKKEDIEKQILENKKDLEQRVHAWFSDGAELDEDTVEPYLRNLEETWKKHHLVYIEADSRRNASEEKRQTLSQTLQEKKDKQEQNNVLYQQELYCLSQLKFQRRELFGEEDPKQTIEVIEKKIINARDEKEISAASYTQSEVDKSNAQARLETLVKTINTQSEQLQENLKTFQLAISQAGFQTQKDYELAQMDAKTFEMLNNKSEEIKTLKATLKANISNNDKLLEQEKARQLSQKSLVQLREDKKSYEAQKSICEQKIGEIKGQFDMNDQNHRTYEHKIEELTQLKEQSAHWSLLNELIGSSDGKKYRNFAQGLTFSIMIGYANRQLQKMTDRYLLQQDKKSPLDLTVVDRYQDNEIRSTKNLSGGESFIVSLALALGLSQMASKNVRVDSLFLDEGFGTLDEDSLDTALDMLASLHADGKVIGVISHVAALKDRIPTQIQVEPRKNGRSKISGPGCLFLN